MQLGGSPGAAWLITVGFLLLVIAPMLYLTWISIRRDHRPETTQTES